MLLVVTAIVFFAMVVSAITNRRSLKLSAPFVIDGERMIANMRFSGYADPHFHWLDVGITLTADGQSDGDGNAPRYRVIGIPEPFTVKLEELRTGRQLVREVQQGAAQQRFGLHFTEDGAAFQYAGVEHTFRPGPQFRAAAFIRSLWSALVRSFICSGMVFLFIWALTDPKLWSRRIVLPPVGICHQCGYNLHGIDSPRCPECGAARDRSSPQRSVPDERDA